MILRLVFAELRHRPGRALFLLGGYSLGVAVMIVLLAVGEAMLEQARDQTLVGGGDLVLLPAGISAELLRAGGATALFLGIDQARFVQRDVLESPRAREEYGVLSASPVLEGRIVELIVGDELLRALAGGEIPSRAAAAGAAPALIAGSWADTDADRRWTSPDPHELYREIDRFHLPPAGTRDSTWAEWHYFNVDVAPGSWIYLTSMVAGEVGIPDRWGGRVLLTIRSADGTHRSITLDRPDREVRFDTLSPDLSIGSAASVELVDGVYRIRAVLPGARVDLRIRPVPRRYFPPTELGGAELLSGYVAPALLATAEGEVCLPGCTSISGARAYHDHNWGVWRDVSWEWGSASDEELSLLYGVVRGQEPANQPLFAYLVDGDGLRGLFRPALPSFPETELRVVGGNVLRIPTVIEFADARRGLSVRIEVDAAHVTDLERPNRRFFVQMRGRATVSQLGYAPRTLDGFFETYVDPEGDAAGG